MKTLEESWIARLSGIGWPLTMMLGAAALWELVVRALNIPKWLLPALSVVLLRIGQDATYLGFHAGYTLYVIVSGFLVAIAVGVPLALMIASWRFAEKAFYPLLVFSQTVPKIAIAPLFVIWTGSPPQIRTCNSRASKAEHGLVPSLAGHAEKQQHRRCGKQTGNDHLQ